MNDRHQPAPPTASDDAPELPAVVREGLSDEDALRLLDLSDNVREAIREGRLSPAHGRALAAYKAFPALQRALADLAQDEQWPSKRLEDKECLGTRRLEQAGPVKPLGYTAPLDSAVCQRCLFEAYRNLPVGGPVCLRPAHYAELTAAADADGAARVLTATLWYPTAALAGSGAGAPPEARPDPAPAPRGPFPVLVYSHGGCGGDPRAIAQVSAHLASHGFVLVAFPHPGSTRTDCAAAGPGWMAGWRERPGDMAAVLDLLTALDADAGWALRGAADPGRAGVLGHSQGGQTALVAAATDPRVRAAVAVAPLVLHPDTLALVERLLTDLERGR